jgi:hypothetical protein
MSTRPLLWGVVVFGTATIVTASVLTMREDSRKEAAKKHARDDEDDDGNGCCAGDAGVVRPATETLGRADAPVKVVGFVPDDRDYNEVIAMLRRLAGAHADAVNVTLRSTATSTAKEEMKRLGHDGAGFFVGGRKQFRLRNAEGTPREVVFEGKPGKKYKLQDLKAVIEEAMAKAEGGDAASTDAGPPGKAG